MALGAEGIEAGGAINASLVVAMPIDMHDILQSKIPQGANRALRRISRMLQPARLFHFASKAGLVRRIVERRNIANNHKTRTVVLQCRFLAAIVDTIRRGRLSLLRLWPRR